MLGCHFGLAYKFWDYKNNTPLLFLVHQKDLAVGCFISPFTSSSGSGRLQGLWVALASAMPVNDIHALTVTSPLCMHYLQGSAQVLQNSNPVFVLKVIHMLAMSPW